MSPRHGYQICWRCRSLTKVRDVLRVLRRACGTGDRIGSMALRRHCCRGIVMRNQPPPRLCVLVRPVPANKAVGRAVVVEDRLCSALELDDDALRQRLAQFDSPLIE